MGSVSAIVGLTNLVGDASALRDLVTLLLGPLTNLVGSRASGGPTTTGTATTGETSIGGPPGQIIAQLGADRSIT